MSGWAIFGLYVLGYLLLWRKVVWAVLEDGVSISISKKPDSADIVCALIIGSMATLVWPLIALGLAVRTIYLKRTGEALYALMPRNVRRERELDDRERRIGDQEKRIHELELANGMDPATGKFNA